MKSRHSLVLDYVKVLLATISAVSMWLIYALHSGSPPIAGKERQPLDSAPTKVPLAPPDSTPRRPPYGPADPRHY